MTIKSRKLQAATSYKLPLLIIHLSVAFVKAKNGTVLPSQSIDARQKKWYTISIKGGDQTPEPARAESELNMNQAERFTKARELAVNIYMNVEGQPQVAVGSWIVDTEEGLVRLTAQAVKGEVDVAEEVANYQFELQERATRAAAKKAEKDVKVAKAKAAKAE